MDPRGAAALSSSATSALARLTGCTGTRFPNLEAARRETAAKLATVRTTLAELETDPTAAVVLMGSWGREELTSGSDNDFAVLINGPEIFRDRPPKPRPGDVRKALKGVGRDPGAEGTFGGYMYTDQLAGRIGLDRDDNRNLTRRVLLLLESIPGSGDDAWMSARNAIRDEYLKGALKDERPPRLLLNDVVRYWRTICVDFAGKQRAREGQGWGLRNAKLRLSRKVLFSAGLFPVLRCREHAARDIPGFLRDQFGCPPTDRLAEAFLTYDLPDAGARALRAYDDFIGILDDPQQRLTLDETPQNELEGTDLFRNVRALGDRFQDALLALMFETELSQVAREFAVF